MFGRNAARAHLIVGTICGLFAIGHLIAGAVEWRHSTP